MVGLKMRGAEVFYFPLAVLVGCMHPVYCAAFFFFLFFFVYCCLSIKKKVSWLVFHLLLYAKSVIYLVAGCCWRT